MAVRKIITRQKYKPVTVVMYKMDYDIAMLVYRRFTAIGLSDEEVSFLMGQRNKYVFDLLNPTQKNKFKTEHLDILPTILECGIRTLVPNEINANKDIILRGVKKVTGKKVVYDYAVIQPDGTAIAQPPVVKQIVTGYRKILHPEVHALTMSLIKNGHFDEPKNALELYLFYKHNLNVDFRPVDLQKSIAMCLRNGKVGEPLLVEQRVEARYIYKLRSG